MSGDGSSRIAWSRTGASVASRQQEICDTLARTADGIGARSQAHASDTIAEVDYASGTVLRRLKAGEGGDGMAILP